VTAPPGVIGTPRQVCRVRQVYADQNALDFVVFNYAICRRTYHSDCAFERLLADEAVGKVSHPPDAIAGPGHIGWPARRDMGESSRMLEESGWPWRPAIDPGFVANPAARCRFWGRSFTPRQQRFAMNPEHP
jgi:hypothetical protein